MPMAIRTNEMVQLGLMVGLSKSVESYDLFFEARGLSRLTRAAT
jgi:hypothetical protein